MKPRVFSASLHRPDTSGGTAGGKHTMQPATPPGLLGAGLLSSQPQYLEALGRFAAGVAHNLNNILTVVLSNAQLLAQDPQGQRASGPTEVRQRQLANIMDAGERGVRFTNQLLAFSMGQPLAPQAIDLAARLAGVLERLQTATDTTGRVTLESSRQVSRALVDPDHFDISVNNLIANARDAMGPQGRLSFAVRNRTVSQPARSAGEPEPGEYVELSVSDNGKGMSGAVLKRACEPFYTTKAAGEGAGLGLAQVYGFARQSGGGIRVCSRQGKGTTVRLYLPSAGPAAPAAEAPAENRWIAAPTRTVLLVDDDHAVREVTSLMLTGLGFRVLEAEGARTALEILDRDADIELMLTDFAMPGMNGVDLAHAARRRRPDLPVVFVTGYARFEGSDMQGVQILQKPFREHDLSERIDRALRCAPQANSTSRTPPRATR